MPALNFSAQFATLVEEGDKRQTIRAPRKDGRPHCNVGDTIKLFTGMRSKSCRLLREARVTRVDRIIIHDTWMELNGQRQFGSIEPFQPITDNQFAINDGFENFMDMAFWFEKIHGPLPFTGVVIYWD